MEQDATVSVAQDERATTASSGGTAAAVSVQDETAKHVRKRKRADDERVTQSYIEELNEVIFLANEGIRYDATAAKRRECFQQLQSTRIGATVWTAEEKARLFNALAIYGRNLVMIAAAIKTDKSPLQVREYLMILEDASVEYRQEIGPQRWKIMLLQGQNPACELDGKLEQSLDVLARAVEKRQRTLEEREEMDKHGKYWLLDLEIAKKVHVAYKRSVKRSKHDGPTALSLNSRGNNTIDQPLTPSEASQKPSDDVELLLQSVPAARLLNLQNLVRLSYLYMSGEKWKFNEAGPALRQTAFSDLRNLVISVTRRVVGAVLFHATIEHGGQADAITEADIVRPKHVRAALDTLNMRHDAHEFWADMPRRCGLSVEDEDGFAAEMGGDVKEHLSLEQAEALLRRPVYKRWRRRTRSRLDCKSSRQQLSTSPADAAENEVDFESNGASDADSASASEDSDAQSESDSSSVASDSASEISFATDRSRTSDSNDSMDTDAESSASEVSSETSELLAIHAAIFDPSQSSVSSAQLAVQLDTVRAVLAQETAEEAYLEARDQQDSAAEHIRLLRILGDDAGAAERATGSGMTAHALTQAQAFESAVLSSSKAMLDLTEHVGDWRDRAHEEAID